MAKQPAAKKSTETVDIQEIKTEEFQAYILGQTPLICHAMSAKVKGELLLPKGRKTQAEKATTLKHDPLQEYRDSIYSSLDPEFPTLITIPGAWIKKAIMGASLDIPGATKAQMGRLVIVPEINLPLWGIPQLFMSVTRSADMNKTPDVRTRAIVPAWCTRVTIRYASPLMKGPILIKLLAAAGLINGIGDWRTQKGSGNFGSFSVVDDSDPMFKLIQETAGRSEQIDAMENPDFYDSETAELFTWYGEELTRRGIEDKKPVKAKLSTVK